MFDDDQETPNTLNCAFEFEQPDGRRKMMEFEVRHWITNNEASLGHGLFNRHNAIGNIFYGSTGYLAAGNEDSFSYESWLGSDQQAGPSGKSGRPATGRGPMPGHRRRPRCRGRATPAPADRLPAVPLRARAPADDKPRRRPASCPAGRAPTIWTPVPISRRNSPSIRRTASSSC